MSVSTKTQRHHEEKLELPDGWRWVKLDQALEMADSGIWGEPDPDNGMSILRSTNFRNDGTFDLTDLAFRAIPAEKRNRKVLIPGDIVLERSGGGPQQPVGRVCFFEGDKRDHGFGNFCQRLRARSGICDARFLFWHLYLFHMSGQTQLYQKQTTGIRNLEYKRYLAHKLSLPPLAQQRRIAGVLREQMAVVEKARTAAQARLAAVKDLPAAFLRQVFPQPSQPLPNGWRWVKLGKVSSLQSGYAFKSEWFEDKGIRLLRNANVFQDRVSWDDVVYLSPHRRSEFREYELCEGDIVLSLDRPIVNAGLKIARFSRVDIPALLLQRVGRFVLQECIFSDYLFVLLHTESFKAAITAHDYSLGVPHVSPDQIEAIEIPLPPLPVQRRIAGVLKEQMAAVEKARVAAEEELKTINTLPAALLRRAFAGEA
jgi:type I restriction enzyme S subunit